MYWNLFAEETRKINIIIKIFWTEKKDRKRKLFLPHVKVPDSQHRAVITKAADLWYKPEVKGSRRRGRRRRKYLFL